MILQTKYAIYGKLKQHKAFDLFEAEARVENPRDYNQEHLGRNPQAKGKLMENSWKTRGSNDDGALTNRSATLQVMM